MVAWVSMVGASVLLSLLLLLLVSLHCLCLMYFGGRR
jgi:hypothetical protein